MVNRFRYARHICILLCISLTIWFFTGREKAQNAVSFDSPLELLIIDPGHGGADGGAVGIDGIIESQINLQIALKLESMCHLFGVTTVMTRDSEEIEYPADADTIAKMKLADQNARLRLIRDYPHGILFSIHQNYYPSEKPNGVEVLYGHSEDSREVGQLLQYNLTAALCPNSRRVAAEIKDEIYLFRECGCTAALIECGFLSNPTEAELLQTENYQKKIAAVLLASYLQYTND